MLGVMGFENLAPRGIEQDLALHEQFRDQFPVTEHLIYLNHAAVAPLCRPAAEAIRWLAGDACNFGSSHYGEWLAAYEGLRKATATLIHSAPDEIAIVKNTSEGIAMVAGGIDWQEGDRVVAFREEFPANYYPWQRLANRGVHVHWLSIEASIDEIAAAAAGARLLAISFVNYLSGYRVDVKAIGDVCRSHNCFFFVDAIQGLGAFPLDVEECSIDALAADGHKWMLGPEGNGILYVRKSRLDEIEPVEFGWTNPAGYNDYSSRDMTLRADAGRYECGTLNTVGCFGQKAALELLLEVGIERIAPVVFELATRIEEGVRSKGYEVMAERTAQTGSGIVSFRHPKIDARQIVSDLKQAHVAAAPRQGWVRTSPHFYVSPESIDIFLRSLPPV